MNRIVLNFGDYILNEKRKEAELFLSNKINESNEFGDLISPIEFIKTRTNEKIDYFFKDKPYKENLKTLDLNSVIVDIVNSYESGGGEPGLTWDSLQKTLLVQESAGSAIVKYSARVESLLSKVRNPKIKVNISLLHKAIKTKMKDVSVPSFSEFLTKNADVILKKTSPQKVPTGMDAWGPIIPRTKENTTSVFELIEDRKIKSSLEEKLNGKEGERYTMLGVTKFLEELSEIVMKKKPEDITNSVQSSRILRTFGDYSERPIDDIFKMKSIGQVIDFKEVIESGIRPYIIVNGDRRIFFLGDFEVKVDSFGYMFLPKSGYGYKNIEGKDIVNIDDYKKSFVDLFQKYVNPQDYNETFVKKYGVPSFKIRKSIEGIWKVKSIKGADEPIEEIELNTILDEQVGPAVVQTEEQLKVPDKKDYNLVKKIFTMRNSVVAGGAYAFWELWARDYWKKFGSETLYFPSQFPKEFIKQTNLRIQGLDSFNNLKNFMLQNKVVLPEDVLPKISYYIAQNMQSYYGKIMPTYIAAITIHEASK